MRESREIVQRPAAPTTGYWFWGSVVFNSEYSAGEPALWVCTVSGEPGTWVGVPVEPPDGGVLVSTTGVQTLTNKTLTAPVLTTPALGVATATSLNGLTVSTTTGTLTLANGSSIVTSGGNAITFTSSGATNVTLPTAGTLATLTGTEVLTNKKLGSLTTNGLVTTSGSDGTLSVTVPGTGVATALAVNVGSAGAFVTFNGALGSPSSAGTMPAFTLGGVVSGGGQQVNNVIIGTVTPLAGSFTTGAFSTSVTVTSASASALVVGLAGATNPVLQVDSSTGLQAAGLKLTGAVTGGTVALAAIDSGANTNLTINAKGSGTIGIGSVSTGAVTITPALTVTGLITATAAGISLPTATTATTFSDDGTGSPGTSASVNITTQIVGGFVHFNIPLFTLTTGTGPLQIQSNTAVAAAYRPAADVWLAVPTVRNNGVSVAGGVLRVQTNGVFTFYRDGNVTAYTNASSCGLNNNFAGSYKL